MPVVVVIPRHAANLNHLESWRTAGEQKSPNGTSNSGSVPVQLSAAWATTLAGWFQEVTNYRPG